MVIPDKICPHCGGNRWYVNIGNNRTYYKTFKYLSDRSKIYTYIENYLKDNNIPHTFEIQYEQCYIYNKKEDKQVKEKKLLFTIKIT